MGAGVSFLVNASAAVLLLSLPPSAFAQAPTASDEFFMRNKLVPISPGNQYKAKPGTLIINPTTWIRRPDAEALVQNLPQPEHVPETVQLDEKGRSIFATLMGYNPSVSKTNGQGVRFSEIDLDGQYIDDGAREDKLMVDGSPTTKLWEEWEKGSKPYAIYMITATFTTTTLHAAGLSSSDLNIQLGTKDTQGCKVLTKDDLASIPKPSEATPASPKPAEPTSEAPKPDTSANAGTSTKPGAKPKKDPAAATATGAGGITQAASDAAKKIAAAVPEGGVRICDGSVGTVDMAAKRPVPVAMKVCQIFWYEGSQSYACEEPNAKNLRF